MKCTKMTQRAQATFSFEFLKIFGMNFVIKVSMSEKTNRRNMGAPTTEKSTAISGQIFFIFESRKRPCTMDDKR